MAQLFEGDVVGKVINPEIGGSPPKVKWEMIVTEGEHKGKRASYSGKFDADNVKYTKRDMMLVGWKGQSSRTFVEDVKAANAIVPFTAEIASTTYPDSGKTSTWTSAKFSGGKPLAALDRDGFDKVDRWLNEAGEITPSGSKPPTSNGDVPF